MVWRIRHGAGAKGNKTNGRNKSSNGDGRRSAESGRNSFHDKSSTGSSSSSKRGGTRGRQYLFGNHNRLRSRNRCDSVLERRYQGRGLREERGVRN